MSTISANNAAQHTPVSMFRSVSTESSGSSAAINPSTAARLQRLPTPPRSPGLVPLGRQLTLIEPPMTKGVRFLILDCPTDSTLPFYLAELKRNNVTDVVRCCEPTYRAETLQSEGITVHDWPFRDGAVVGFFSDLIFKAKKHQDMEAPTHGHEKGVAEKHLSLQENKGEYPGMFAIFFHVPNEVWTRKRMHSPPGFTLGNKRRRRTTTVSATTGRGMQEKGTGVVQDL